MHKTKVVPPESHAQASCGAWRGREAADPVDYKHPYLSMAQYAELLALRFDAKRTRHAYYRAMRVLHEHFQCDPATLQETHLRDYLLHVKLHKHWKPKTIHQTLACQVAFVEWTDAGHLRHCTFIAMRDDKNPSEVVRET